jgi:uncharacterized membrane protein YeaQ/YmgE (transglycosylase-associated protein family)
MSVMEVIVLLVIAAICGGIAEAIVGFSRGGCIVSIAVGFIGALIGTWLAREFNLPELFVINVGGTAFPVLWSIIGGVLFTALVSLLVPRRGRL